MPRGAHRRVCALRRAHLILRSTHISNKCVPPRHGQSRTATREARLKLHQNARTSPQAHPILRGVHVPRKCVHSRATQRAHLRVLCLGACLVERTIEQACTTDLVVRTRPGACQVPDVCAWAPSSKGGVCPVPTRTCPVPTRALLVPRRTLHALRILSFMCKVGLRDCSHVNFRLQRNLRNRYIAESIKDFFLNKKLKKERTDGKR